MLPQYTPAILSRFWSKVDRSGDCWIWTGKLIDGYGCFSITSRWSVLVHRLTFELTHGPIPPGLLVCHTCDNPPCCNPAHLWAGTNADNMADSIAKGRRPRGEQKHGAKLTESNILAIRAQYAAGGVTMQRIADQFGVTNQTISEIVHRQKWSHVT